MHSHDAERPAPGGEIDDQRAARFDAGEVDRVAVLDLDPL